VDGADASPLGHGAHPPVGGAPVEAVAVMARQDGARRPLAGGQVDGPGRPRYHGNDGRLVALADDPQSAGDPRSNPRFSMSAENASLTRRPFSPRSTAKPACAWSTRWAANRNPSSSVRSRPRASLGWTLGRRTYWAGLDAIRPSMWAKR
jgi:hypothetical protein